MFRFGIGKPNTKHSYNHHSFTYNQNVTHRPDLVTRSKVLVTMYIVLIIAINGRNRRKGNNKFFQIDSHKSNGLCKVTSNLKSFT